MHSFTFDGRSISFVPGQTVGAALTAAGVRSWRLTRKAGRPRGLFCGIGVCFDCLAAIDGQLNQRACLTLATDQTVVVTQEGTGHDD